MRDVGFRSWITRVGIVLGTVTFSAALLWADTPLPSAPASYVYDEPHVLKPETLTALQALLAVHDRKTSEQVVVSVFNSLGDEDLVAWTNKIFQHWKIGQRGKDNGVLLALYWKDRKIRIEVGYGLEPLLTDAKSKRIISGILVPNLKEGRPDQAVILSALAILQEIHSPLIQSGEADKILKEGGFHLGHGAPPRQQLPPGLLFLGLIVFIIVIHRLDRRFGGRRSGWNNWGGGGGFGGGSSGGGDGGGFSGGGGSSGGGGASGDW